MPYRHLTQLLTLHFETLSPELQRAARWVGEHPAELGLQSMRQSAQAAGVSPATMTRLAHALGLTGFDDMRRPSMTAFAQSVARAGPEAAAPSNVTQDDRTPNPMVAAQVGNVQSVGERNTPQQFAAAAQAILAAREVLFLGLRASFGMAHHLHYTCDWLRPGARLASDSGGALVDQTMALEPTDLLVVISQAPYARQVVALAKEVFARGVPVLALTDSVYSPLVRCAQHTLQFNTASPAFFHSMTGALALSESLMACVAEQGGASVVQRLRERQRRLQDTHAYWEKPLPRPGQAADIKG